MLWFRLKGRPATPSPSLFSQERCVSHEPTGKTARPDRTVGRGRVHHLARDQQGGPSLLGALLGTRALLQTQRALSGLPVFTCLIFHTDHPSHAPNTTKPVSLAHSRPEALTLLQASAQHWLRAPSQKPTPPHRPPGPGPPVCRQGNAAHRGRDLASSFVLPSRPSATSGQGGREPRARSRPPRPTPGGTGPGARGASYLSSY